MSMMVDLRGQLAAVAQLAERAKVRRASEPEPAAAPSPAVESQLELLRTRLGLTATELQVVWLLVGFELDPAVRRALDAPAITYGALLDAIYADQLARGLAELSPTGALHRYLLVEIDPAEHAKPFNQRAVRIADRVLELATGTVRLDPAIAALARIDDTPPAVLAELVIDPDTRARVQAAMAGELPPALVLVGGRGTGRRSLLAAALAARGQRVLAIDAPALPADRELARRQLRALGRECRLLQLVPLVRDLDALAASGELADRVELFETELPAPRLATATRKPARRWLQSPTTIELAELATADRARLWQRALPDASSADAELLAGMYPLAPAWIAEVGRVAVHQRGDQVMQPHHIEAGLRAVLDDRLAGLATRVTVTQTWDDLILPDDQMLAIIELMARVRERARVYEQWGFAAKLGKGLGLTALFSGPPGTGKSMAAGLIAQSLGVELYQVDLSKIVSKWIGETEKNLATLFDVAEAGHAVLLFDEADALFGKRTEVRSSNDRHANQEVNFLLQRLETFRGICMLTSNHDAAIDDAFRRRLTTHVRFTLPELGERKRLWRAMLPAAAPVRSELALDALASRFEMSGGYIRNAVLRAAFLAADDDTPISADHLARAADLEYEAMGRIA